MAAGRKPAHLEMQGGKGNRQRVWEAMRKNPAGITLYALARVAQVDDNTVLSYLRCLIAGGYVERNGRTYNDSTYTLLRDVGAEAPKLNRDGTPNTQGRGVEAMWRSLRILREIDADELVESTKDCGEPVSLATARSYIAWLYKAEYLVLITPASHGHSARYRLTRGGDTGPRAPMIQRIGQVFDPNVSEVVYRQPVPEVDE